MLAQANCIACSRYVIACNTSVLVLYQNYRHWSEYLASSAYIVNGLSLDLHTYEIIKLIYHYLVEAIEHNVSKISHMYYECTTLQAMLENNKILIETSW